MVDPQSSHRSQDGMYESPQGEIRDLEYVLEAYESMGFDLGVDSPDSVNAQYNSCGGLSSASRPSNEAYLSSADTLTSPGQPNIFENTSQSDLNNIIAGDQEVVARVDIPEQPMATLSKSPIISRQNA